MDAIAILFFIQSENAQKSIGKFFDKLRRDRQQLESRKLCEKIENRIVRDALLIKLSLHYAEVDSTFEVAKTVIDTGLSVLKDTNG